MQNLPSDLQHSSSPPNVSQKSICLVTQLFFFFFFFFFMFCLYIFLCSCCLSGFFHLGYDFFLLRFLPSKVIIYMYVFPSISCHHFDDRLVPSAHYKFDFYFSDTYHQLKGAISCVIPLGQQLLQPALSHISEFCGWYTVALSSPYVAAFIMRM